MKRREFTSVMSDNVPMAPLAPSLGSSPLFFFDRLQEIKTMTVYVIADIKVTDDGWIPAYAASVASAVTSHSFDNDSSIDIVGETAR